MKTLTAWGIVFATLFGGALLSGLQERGSGAQSESARAAISRDSFLAQCGPRDSPGWCISRVGAPDSRQTPSSGRDYWYYEARTFDPLTKKRDRRVQVVIDANMVESVNFY